MILVWNRPDLFTGLKPSADTTNYINSF